MAYKDSPPSQHIEGTNTEKECLELFQTIGEFCGIPLQIGMDSAAIVQFGEYDVLSPDLLVFRDGTTYFIECKSKEATSLYQTYGFATKTLSHYRHIEKKSGIQVLLVVRDKSLAPVGIKDPNAFLVASLSQDGLFDDACILGNTTFLKRENFTPLVNFLEVDLEFAEFLKSYRDPDEDADNIDDEAPDAATAAEELQDAV